MKFRRAARRAPFNVEAGQAASRETYFLTNIEGARANKDKSTKQGAKNNLDVSSVNIVSGKEGEVVSNQIVLLSNLREQLKVNKDLLKPLVYVQEFANVDQKEDEILTWGLLVGVISYLIGLLVVLIKEVK